MAAYAQFGYGYPSANQLLSGGGVVQSTMAAGIPQAPVSTATAPSPLSGANEASLSPSGGSTATGVTTGPMSPGAISQTSNNAGNSVGAGVEGAAASIVGVGGTAVASASGASCCENGRPIMTDPVSGQTVCSCQYDSARLALSGYSRMPASSVSVYGTPYPSTEQNPYPSIGVDSSAFYSPLGNPYGLKDSSAGSDMTAWTSAGLQPTTGYYSYDPTLAAYGYGAGYDLAARRKNATRESTATLKAWLNEHKKNPYPTKGEKIMLAIITKMTLTQVSTWFANARRRLKKENKMTWEPKNKTEDDDDAMLSDDEKDGKDAHESEKAESIYGTGSLIGDHRKDPHHLKSEHEKDDKTDDLTEDDHKPENLAAMRSLSTYSSPYGHAGYSPYQQQQHPSYYQHGGGFGATETHEYGASKNQLSRDCGIPIPATKPKIWSLADTVACKTPPPTAYLGQQYYSQQQPLHQPHSQPQQLPQQMPLISSSSGTNMGEQLTPMEQQQQLPQQPNPAALNSPLSMMNSYVAGSPYSRIPTGYTINAFSSGNNSNSSTGMPTTPTTPPSMSAHHQQQHQQHQHQLQQYQAQQQQQQRMGFPEIQPDTPPQTPPNMKHSSGNGSAANQPLGGPTVAPTTGMCYTSGGLNRPYSNGGPSSGNPTANYVGIMATSRAET